MRLTLLLILLSAIGYSQNTIDDDIASIESQLIEWRRHFHQFPELSNREFNTAKKIAEYLR
ncbi:MAG: amidohydrolase, partial [Winogradskyella sp.]|nr:amidohydrolase [Winogradskyella sp.]